MEIFLALIAGFFGGVPAAFLTYRLTEKRRSDPLAIALRLKQLELAAQLFAKTWPILDLVSDYIQGHSERTQFPHKQTKEALIDARAAFREEFRPAYVYLPVRIIEYYNRLWEFCDRATMRRAPSDFEKQDRLLEELDQLEVDLLNVIRKELEVKELSELSLLPPRRPIREEEHPKIAVGIESA